MSDPRLSASVRLAVGQRWSIDTRSGPSKNTGQQNAGSARPNSTIEHTLLPVLFGILQDQDAGDHERRRCASTIAQYFLPIQSNAKRLRRNAPAPDECGFVVDPDLARELRDLKLELACLPLASKKRSPYLVAQMSMKLQGRMRAIQEALECPCPSKYRLTRHVSNGHGGDVVLDGEIAEDASRIESFRIRRAEKQILTLEEDLEEAIRTARYDSYLLGLKGPRGSTWPPSEKSNEPRASNTDRL